MKSTAKPKFKLNSKWTALVIILATTIVAATCLVLLNIFSFAYGYANRANASTRQLSGIARMYSDKINVSGFAAQGGVSGAFLRNRAPFISTIKTTHGGHAANLPQPLKFLSRSQNLVAMGYVAGVGFVALLIIFFVTRYRSKEQLMRLAYIDSLTGNQNYTAFQKKAAALLAKNQRYAFVLFDINRFKAINNTYGFKEGNNLLLYVSQQLSDFVGEDETFARASDDNFAALLRFDGEEQLRGRLERLFEGMKFFCVPNSGNQIQLNFACGVYVVVNRELPLDYCHENAQMAKQNVKELYDTAIFFYDDALRQKVIETQEIEASMYKALENNEFEVYLQPKYDLKSERIAGAEALIRWHHPTLGFLTPNRFIPIFEHNGFLLKLDCYVYEKVCSILSNWASEGLTPLPIAVNMSRLHVRQQGFVEDLEKMLSRHGVPAELIEIELTETAFFEDTQQIIDVMEKLKDKGFKLSMDDFGSGYSSLNLLNMLPVDIIKLDRMMFTETDKADRSRKVAANAIHIVRDLEMKAVAEGIETKEQVDFLKGIDCDMVQGYYFAKPMPVSQFEMLAYNQVICTDN